MLCEGGLTRVGTLGEGGLGKSPFVGPPVNIFVCRMRCFGFLAFCFELRFYGARCIQCSFCFPVLVCVFMCMACMGTVEKVGEVPASLVGVPHCFVMHVVLHAHVGFLVLLSVSA